MRKSGYNDEEIITVMEMIPKKDYDIILKRKYNDSLIDIISSDDFKENYLDMYLDYYEKNSDEDIQNIITIVNSGYDLDDYPASSLLAKLVNENIIYIKILQDI